MYNNIYSPVKGSHSFCLFVFLFFSLAIPRIAQSQIELIDYIYSGKGSTFLEKPIALVVSNDGNFVYTLSKTSNAISIFSRDASTGDLTFVTAENNMDDASKGLKGGSDLVLSEEGDQLYVAAAYDESITVYNRNASTGLLTLSACHKNNMGGITGLQDVSSLVISPTGNTVFAAGAGEDAIVIFERDREDGSLTYASTKYNNSAGIEGLQYPTDLTLNPVNNYLYATCFTGDAIVVFEIDPYSTALTYKATYYDEVEGVEGLNGAITSAITPDGNFLYTVGKLDQTVSLFAPSTTNHELTFIGISSAAINDAGGLNEATYIASINEGSSILISNSGDNALLLFDKNDEGALSFNSIYENGIDGVGGLAYAYVISESADLKNIYVAGFGEDAIAVFDQDVTTGEIVYNKIIEEVDDVQKMNGTSAVAISPDQQHIYSASGTDNGLVTFTRDSETGMLDFNTNYENGSNGISGLAGAKSVKVSPDGTNVYVTGFIDNAVVVFTRNQSTGLLSFQSKVDETAAEGLRGPCDLLISGDGQFVYVTAFWENALFVFSRNTSTGALSLVEKIEEDETLGIEKLGRLTTMDFSPDENQLYTTSFYDHALIVFNRSSSTGKLTFKEIHENGVNGVSGLSGACGLTVSPTGERVIVAGKKENGAVSFLRNNTTGALTFESVLEAVVDGKTIGALASLQFSPGGTFIYGTSFKNDFLLKFAYDKNTGLFSQGEILTDDEPGINGLDGATAIDLTGDGRFIYVGSYHDDAIAVFKQ